MKRYKAANRLSAALAITGMVALADAANASTLADYSAPTSAGVTLTRTYASMLGADSPSGSTITGGADLSLPQDYTGTQLLSSDDSLGAAGNAYLLFADALARPLRGRQTAIARQLVSYSVAFGPPVTPVVVPLPPALWLLVSGIGGLSAFRSKRPAAP
jgi:hypothetical protein